MLLSYVITTVTIFGSALFMAMFIAAVNQGRPDDIDMMLIKWASWAAVLSPTWPVTIPLTLAWALYKGIEFLLRAFINNRAGREINPTHHIY